MVSGGRAKRPPAIIAVPAMLVATAMVIPIFYLVFRATGADIATVASLVFRPRTAGLLANTAALALGVLTLTTLIAGPLAWLTTRTDLKGARLVNILVTLPLAVPGYVMAYALIGLSGYYGFMNTVFGVTLPRPQGWFGATLALSLYTFPYIYLNLRAALAGIDPSVEESARALGSSPRDVFFRVTLPHLKPALFAGWLVVGLYVIGDFGAVALMRYEVFSYALYTQYAAAYDRIYAAWLALILVALAVSVIWWESRLREGARFARTGTGAGAARRMVRLGPAGQSIAWLFITLIVAAALGLPVAVLVFWLSAEPILPALPALLTSFLQSLSAAVPSAVLAGLLALPVAVLAVRYPSPLSLLVNRLAFLGYAVPPLAFALAFVFFALGAARPLYQTHALLVIAYALAFLPLALGPIRSALYLARPSLEEAARSLGYGPLAVLRHVVLPVIRRGVVAGMVLVFVIVMKELPIAFLLAPTGFRSLAVTLFSRTSEGMMVDAAPYAAAIILFSGLFVGVVLRHETKHE
ncbi:ABC transporter permease [Pararhizobium haloflavum]|uniref:ABC transporter permease n=1 Tax=Pararhizobium haloflavum TaxID=2037914 RepID=UPI001FE035F0|nr:iron ABC transporter permease [Pararhizobium haloflavum]